MDEALEDAIDAAHAALDEDRAADARSVLEGALARAASSPAELRAEALGLAAVAARAEGQPMEARALSERAIALAVSDPELLADLLEDRAEIELALRSPGSAAAHLREAIALREPDTAETWMALADALFWAGEHDEVLEALARAAPLATRDADDESLALIAELRGDVALALVDAPEARRAYAEARERWRALGHREAEVRALLGGARAAELQGDRAALRDGARALEALAPGVEGRAEALDELRDLLG